MRKVLICFLAIVIFIPFSAVSVSAATYDLGAPVSCEDSDYYPDLVCYFKYTTYDNKYSPFLSMSLLSHRYMFFPSYTSIFDGSLPLWSFGDLDNKDIYAYSGGHTDNTNVFISLLRGISPRSLYLPTFFFSGVYLPGEGQYLKFSFSSSARVYSDDSNLSDLVSPENLFFLTPSGIDHVVTVPPSTVIVKKNNQYYSYDVYFDMTSEAFNTLDPEYLTRSFDLVIRIPIHHNNSQNFSTGSSYFTSLDFDYPTSYEIITVGGYENDLNNINNSIDKGFSDLIDVYTSQSSEDLSYVLKLENSNSELQNSVNNYQNAVSSVDSIKDQFSLPPLNNSVNENLSNLDTSEVKGLFSLPWLVSALSLVFAFSIIRLILYGTKEG